MSNVTHPSAAAIDSERSGLAAITATRLRQFRQRRLQLQLLRGIAGACLACIASLLLAVLLDAVVEHEWARWAGGLVIYGSSLIGLYWLCIRPSREPVDLPRDAREFEDIEPRLRHRLLSAVELSGTGPAGGDSMAFRQQLQWQVARLIEPLDVRQLLSSAPAQRAGGVALAAILGFSLLCVVPGLKLPQRVARSLFPWMNLGRVANVAIVIEQPAPASAFLPLGDLVAITARIDGQPQEVWLESRTAGDGYRSRMQAVPTTPSGSDAAVPLRFETTLTVTDPVIDYRVVAGGARTPWYRLTAAPRPAVESFEKRIQPPDYSQTETVLAIEEHGDIRALQGSSVNLRLAVNQPIASAELDWVGASGERRIPLAWSDSLQRLTGELSVDESGTYRVVLESQATGFTNAFAPRHAVTAIPDLPPRVDWVLPRVNLIAAGTHELLTLEIEVDDELPLAKLEQCLRLADADWKRTPLPLPAAGDDLPQRIAWTLDLQPFELPAGSQVEVKVAATDRRGNTSESTTTRFLISSTSLDLRPTPLELARLELARACQQLADRLREAGLVAGRRERAAAEGSLAAEDVTSASQSLQGILSADLPAMLGQAEQALTVTNRQVETKELRLIADIISDSLSNGLYELTRGQPLPADATQDVIQKQYARVTELAGRFVSLSEHVRSLVTHDIARRHAEQMARLAQSQAELSQAAIAETAQLLRRQQVLSQQLRQLQESMVSATEDVQEISRRRWRDSVERIGTMLDQLEAQLETASTDRVRSLIAASAASLDEGRLISRIDGNIYESYKKAHSWLIRNTLDPGSLLAELARVTDRLGTSHPESAQLLQETVRTLRDHREHARASLLGDPVWASDLGLASRALQAVDIENSNPKLATETWQSLVPPLHVLTTAADLRLAISELRELLERERWSLNAFEASLESPRGWDSFFLQLEKTSADSRSAKLPNAWTSRLDQLRWNDAARRAGANITERRWNRGQPKAAIQPLQALMQELKALQRDLQPLESEARAQLHDLAPSVVELAQRAAEQTRAVSQQTAELGQQVLSQALSDPAPELSRLNTQVRQLAEPLQQLREALVDQADAQNLLDQHEVQLAARSDTAIHMVDQITQQAASSLDRIPPQAAGRESADIPPQATALAEAAISQADAAQALDEIAKFLEQSPDSSEAATQAEGLAELPLGNPVASSQAAYAQADRLAQLARTQPAEVLRALEHQLQQDEPMQQEMSVIARSAASEALQELERAAQEQAQLTPDLERSDPRHQAQHDLLVQDLRSAREEADGILTTLLNEAKATALAGRATTTEREFRELEQQLRQAVDEAAQVSSQDPFSNVQQVAQDFQSVLQEVEQRASQLAQQLRLQEAVAIHENGASLNNRRREMKDRQRRIFQQDVRNLQQAERAEQQRVRQLESQAGKIRQQVASQAQQLEQLQKRLSENPDQASLHRDSQVRAQKLALLREALTATERSVEAVQDRARQAGEAVQQANRRPTAKLESVNPSAELSASLSELTAERSAALASRLQAWTPSTPPQPQAARDALNAAADQQERVASQVDAAAATLDRAARHEQRLGNQAPSEQLASLAEQLSSQVDGALTEAGWAIRVAQANAEEPASETGQANAATTAAATRATAQAAAELKQSAVALQDVLAGQSTSQATMEAATPGTSTDPTSNESPATAAALQDTPLNPQQLAQLLDELDRQLNASAAPSEPASQASLGPQDNNSQNPPTGNSSPQVAETLTEAAKKLAAQLSRGREAPSAQGTQDLGMATESEMANANPQPPVAVEFIESNRNGQTWGDLRQQRAEGTTKSQQSLMAPQFRDQVEAYFKNLSIESHKAQDAR